MKKKKKMKKKVKITIIIIVIILVILLSVGAYFLFFNKNEKKEVRVEHEIKGYGYVLKDSKSKKYKSLFYKLEKVLKDKPVNEKKYVKLISRMFLLDFYSLDEKVAKTDVGGIDFIYGAALTDFLEESEDTVYKYLESDLYNQRKQKLPTVSDVKIDSVTQEEFTYGEEYDSDAYTVKATIEYKDDKDMGYPRDATLKFIHEDNKLSLAEVS